MILENVEVVWNRKWNFLTIIFYLFERDSRKISVKYLSTNNISNLERSNNVYRYLFTSPDEINKRI